MVYTLKQLADMPPLDWELAVMQISHLMGECEFFQIEKNRTGRVSMAIKRDGCGEYERTSCSIKGLTICHRLHVCLERLVPIEDDTTTNEGS